MIVNEKEAAKRLGISPRLLQRERAEGRLGIPFARVGYRRIGYDTEMLDEWLATRVRRSLAEERAAKTAALVASPPRRRGKEKTGHADGAARSKV